MSNKSGWNYRQVKTINHHSYVKNGVHKSFDSVNVSIYEVFYNKKGKIKCWSAEPVAVSSGGDESVKNTLELMLSALDKPMLIFEKMNDGIERLVKYKPVN